MAEQYEPELGQAIFGQAAQELKVPNNVEAALDAIKQTLNSVHPAMDNPFNNIGSRFRWPSFQVHSYSWGEDDQRFNFKWRDFEVSWYKYFGRGLSMSRRINPAELKLMLTMCLDEIMNHEPKEDWS